MPRKTIYITSMIGPKEWGDSVTSLDSIKKQMAGAKETDEIVVLINSPGGSVFEGIAIYNYLRDFKPTFRIIGMAASIASIIPMGGKKVTMGPGAMFITHEPWTFAVGDQHYMKKVADQLDQIKGSLVEIYQTRMKMSADEIKDWLKEEKYHKGEEAKKLNLTDEYNDDPHEPSYNMNSWTTFAALMNTENKDSIINKEAGKMPTIEELQNKINSLESTINDKDSEINTAKSKITDLENQNSQLTEDLKQAKIQSLNNKKAQIQSEEEQFVNKLVDEKKIEASQKEFLVNDLVNRRLDENQEPYNQMREFLNSKTVNPLTQPQATKNTADTSGSFSGSDFSNEQEEDRILAEAKKLSKSENISFEEALNRIYDQATEGNNVY
jgi:ATP-dependent protease ClpP protease subunit